MSAPTVRLGEIASLQAGIGFPPALQGRSTGDFPFAKVGDISRCGRSDSSVLSTADHYVDQADVTQLRAKLVPAGSILFAKIGEAIRQNHRVVAGCDMLIDNNAMAAIPSDRVDGRFLYNYLKTVDFYALAPATTVPALRKSELETLRVPLPPLEEQRRIAAILDQAETLRTQRRQALAHLDTLTQSLFLDMFGDVEAKGWPIEAIAAVAHADKGSMRTGPFGSQLLHSEFVDEGVAVLGIDNAVANEFRWGERRFISEAKYRDLKRYTVKPGDVLITIMGTCGRCAVVPNDIPVAINTKHICCITLDKQKCMPEFLHAYFLRHPMARKYLAQTEKGAIMAGLNMGLIQAMPIPVPPLPLQQTFATRIQAIEALKATHRTALAQLDALFASLQQRAFAGEL